MTEAVEYRIKRTRARLNLVVATVYVAAAMTVLSLSHPQGGSALSVGAAVTTAATAFAGLHIASYHAAVEDGRLRTLHERVYGEYADPPLNEWEERLESEGAFNGGVKS